MAFSGELTQPIVELSTEDSHATRVMFEDGTVASVSATGPLGAHHRRLLELLKKLDLPAYVRAEDGVVQRVLAPSIGRVMKLERLPDNRVQVDLDTAPERFVLEEQHPGWLSQLAESLKTETAVVVVGDAHRIVSVEPAKAVTGRRPERLPADASVMAGVTRMDLPHAQEAFAHVSAVTCELPPDGPAPPCIPFQYSYGYCFARAHVVCEILKAEGIDAGKMWLFGDLQFSTRNAPDDCLETWSFHVAPFVRDDSSSVNTIVFDPSVAPAEPLTGRTWRRRIHGQAAARKLTFMDVQLLASDLKPVDVPADFCHEELDIAREKFIGQCVKHGPPPYDCR